MDRRKNEPRGWRPRRIRRLPININSVASFWGLNINSVASSLPLWWHQSRTLEEHQWPPLKWSQIGLTVALHWLHSQLYRQTPPGGHRSHFQCSGIGNNLEPRHHGWAAFEAIDIGEEDCPLLNMKAWYGCEHGLKYIWRVPHWRSRENLEK